MQAALVTTVTSSMSPSDSLAKSKKKGVLPVTLLLGGGAGAGATLFVVACPAALTLTWRPAALHTARRFCHRPRSDPAAWSCSTACGACADGTAPGLLLRTQTHALCHDEALERCQNNAACMRYLSPGCTSPLKAGRKPFTCMIESWTVYVCKKHPVADLLGGAGLLLGHCMQIVPCAPAIISLPAS